MSRKVFAVCDPESDYVCRLAEYLHGRLGSEFEIQVFTSQATLCAYGEEKPLELLLISAAAMSDQVQRLACGQVVLLSEGEIPEQWDGYPWVYKYQNVKALVGEVMGFCAQAEEETPSSAWERKVRLYGIYSPAPPAEKTAFALALGQRLAQDSRALYLNLEDFAGFEFLMDRHFQSDLSDLLYVVRQGQEGLSHRLEGMVQTVERLDYVPPAYLPGDLANVTMEEWKRFFEQITSYSGYQAVLAEIGGQMQGLMGILELCDRIYLPIGKDSFSLARHRQFKQVTRMQGRVSILEKTAVLHLPKVMGNSDKEPVLPKEMRDYVEELVREEAYGGRTTRGARPKKAASGAAGSDQGDLGGRAL